MRGAGGWGRGRVRKGREGGVKGGEEEGRRVRETGETKEHCQKCHHEAESREGF